MPRYLLKRLLIFLPTLLVVSLLAFALSRLAPGDPVELYLRSAGPRVGDVLDSRRVYRETAALLGLDKPAFYFSLTSHAYPDTLHRIDDPDHRQTLHRLIANYGNWRHIQDYYRRLRALEVQLNRLPDGPGSETTAALADNLRQLYLSDGEEEIDSRLSRMEELLATAPELRPAAGPAFAGLHRAFDRVKADPQRWRLYVPALHWHGLDNQYHHWFFNFVTGDFGTSYSDGRPVAHKLWGALRWTLLMNALALTITFGLAIPLGVYTALHRGRRFDRLTTLLLFVLYSLPAFWIGTLLLTFFSTPEYGTEWFPTMGIGETSPDVPFGRRLADRAHHLVLPVLCLTYPALAFITRQVRGGMINVLHRDFIRTARAKGLSEREVVWKHAFRNALFPIITLFASVFPGVLAGSVIIEYIFNIPGMGNLTIDAIHRNDWPVVFAVLMLGALLTMTGILVADLLYVLADPRVSFDKKLND